MEKTTTNIDLLLVKKTFKPVGTNTLRQFIETLLLLN